MELSRCLSRDEAKSIFSCIRNNVRPPKSLRFRIIVVPNDALKLSPPAFEYEDGIYVVVRAERETPIEIPSNLTDMVLPDSELALKPSCQWSISGPQNSRSHRMNQRYCYPRGQREYSRNRGGSMWTQSDEYGNELTEYRLFQVYHSRKRAGNDHKVVVAHPKQAKIDDDGREYLVDGLPLLSDDLLISPCPSIDIGSNNHSFDFDIEDIENIFDAKSPVTEHSYSVVPDSTITALTDDIMKNPAFNSCATRAITTSRLHANHTLYPRNTALFSSPTLSFASNKTYASWKSGPSFSLPAPKVQLENSAEKTTQNLMNNPKELSRQLSGFHEAVKKSILGSNKQAQGAMLQMFQSWAKNIAQHPLGLQESKEAPIAARTNEVKIKMEESDEIPNSNVTP
ncbi:hypothetical protein ACHAXS_009384 [Conticribra weissflogii]